MASFFRVMKFSPPLTAPAPSKLPAPPSAKRRRKYNLQPRPYRAKSSTGPHRTPLLNPLRCQTLQKWAETVDLPPKTATLRPAYGESHTFFWKLRGQYLGKRKR